MSKAEERALEAYPEDIPFYVESRDTPGEFLPVDHNLQLRIGYIKGYEQAEKDIMECAVETVVSLEPGANPVIEIGVGRFGLKVRDKVKVIIVKE